ncbi:hypothetical protein Tco_1510710, partial [Tanacetum coccineum]
YPSTYYSGSTKLKPYGYHSVSELTELHQRPEFPFTTIKYRMEEFVELKRQDKTTCVLLGNGQSVCAWYDKWSVVAPLSEFITQE